MLTEPVYSVLFTWSLLSICSSMMLLQMEIVECLKRFNRRGEGIKEVKCDSFVFLFILAATRRFFIADNHVDNRRIFFVCFDFYCL